MNYLEERFTEFLSPVPSPLGLLDEMFNSRQPSLGVCTGNEALVLKTRRNYGSRDQSREGTGRNGKEWEVTGVTGSDGE
jgi:hypothetical protein